MLDEESKVQQPKLEDTEKDRVGTPYYLSPEVWRTNKCTKKSDIWALGVILYELCCFQYPFPATELDELEKKVLTENPQKLPNTVSKLFQDIILKMLKKDEAQRPCIEEIIYSDIFQ